MADKKRIFISSVQKELELERAAVASLIAAGSVSSGWLVKHLKVTYDTANRDLIGLAEANILVRKGKGRASKYLLPDAAGSG
jgi:predicted HTH transcriptional regulator